jgi:hypothetical protein
VDHFAGRIVFVQCGEAKDWHPPLRKVVNLVGGTSLREFMRVLYHAEGVICGVTFAMHLAAALPARDGKSLRPCVVVAGGREPPHWELYPGHQFLHTVGALDCCASGGCWKSRCQPVGDGSADDADLCVRPVTTAGGVQVGRCMEMITPRRVAEAIELYYDGGVLRYESEPAAPTRTRVCAPAGAVAVTIGVGEYAEMAGLAAREMGARTGLRTVVLGGREFAASGLDHPAFLKFRVFDLVEAENVLYFDADTVCLADWDPGPLLDGGPAIACVRERMVPLVLEESARWGVAPAEHFNTGLFVINRRNHETWLRRAEALRDRFPTALKDQLPLNAARVEMGIPLRLLDRRYNWLGFGASSLSHEAPVVVAHRLAPDRQDLNVAYFKGQYQLFEPRVRLDADGARQVSGRTLAFYGASGARRVIRLREDGTIAPPAPAEEPGYWFVHTVNGRPTLALASETTVVHQFVRVLSGAWVGVSAGTADPAREGPRLIEQPQAADPTGNGAQRAARAPRASGPVLTEETARGVADEFVRTIPRYPAGRFRGRGVVVCGGGEKYFPCAWVCIRMLRHVGCALPIELWHVGASEMPRRLRALVEPYGVRCVDAAAVRRRYPVRTLSGWELKPFALLHCAWQEVLLLDADNVAVRDPAYLFHAAPYRKLGAVFWPDFDRLAPDRAIWRICGVDFRDEPEVESGQVLVDKRRCWEPLQLAMHLNEHSDFYYEYVHGDKELFHMAWRMLGREYAMVPHALRPLDRTMCQHDFRGRRVFQHRNLAKWVLGAENPSIPGFRFEDVCREFLDELATARGSEAQWSRRRRRTAMASSPECPRS